MNALEKIERPAPDAAPRKRPAARAGVSREVYRQFRLWHGWLSAFAFLALMFFAVTGLLLNHPDWLPAPEGRKVERQITLSRDELAAARAAPDPARALAEAIGRKTRVTGAYQSGEVVEGEALIRLEGVKGATDMAVDIETGRAEVVVERSDAVTTLNELHRGKNAGAVWKAVIDASAIIILLLSLAGYALFLTLRFRLATSLVLTVVSLALMGAAFFAFVP